jgi:hypothetical protein
MTAIGLLKSLREGLARLTRQCNSHYDGFLGRPEWVLSSSMWPQNAVNRQVIRSLGKHHDDFSECLWRRWVAPFLTFSQRASMGLSLDCIGS